MGGVFETVAVYGSFIAAILSVALLVARRVRSLLSVSLCVGFIGLAIAFVWWLARWFGEGCPDQQGLGFCNDLDTALPVLTATWGVLALLALWVLIRARLAMSRRGKIAE